MAKNIVYISFYDETEVNANGFMQFYDNHKNNNGDDKLHYYSIKKDFIITPFIVVNWLPFLKYCIAKKRFNEDCDFLVIDSSPWTILYHREIIRHFRPKKVIYRQSDPIGYLSGKKHLVQNELNLIQKSKTLFVNQLLYNQYGNKSSEAKDIVICNPGKSIFHPSKSKEKKYKAIYYGKLDLDYQFLIEFAQLNKSLEIHIYGHYQAKHQGEFKNLIFEGFKSIKEIHHQMSESMFFILPYSNENKAVEFIGITSKIVDAILMNCVIVTNGYNKNLVEEEIEIIEGPKNLSIKDYKAIDKGKNLSTIKNKFNHESIFTDWRKQFK